MMEKRDLIYLAAANATSNAFKSDTATSKEAIKECFTSYYQIFSELYDEVPKKDSKFAAVFV